MHSKELLQAAVTPTTKMIIPACTTFVGVGTTGAAVLLQLFALVAQATGRQIPHITRWLTIDADRDSRNKDCVLEQSHVGFVSCGRTGAGTVISNGKELAQESFHDIYRETLSAMTGLSQATDARFSTKPGAHTQTVVIIAGSAGGTSGGTKDLVLTGSHMCSDHLGISEFDVDMLTVCDELPWRDVNRSVHTHVRDLIKANFAESAMWRYGFMASHRPVHVDATQGKIVRMHGGKRLTSNIEFDWDNGFVKLQYMEHLVAMMAHCLFSRYFTATGACRASRQCDDMKTGITGQENPVKAGARHI